jgi:hypothetical protein
VNIGISIYMCGHGELFTRPGMVDLVNQISNKAEKVVLITNGTIDHLDQLKNMNKIRFDVSLDIPQEFCDWNRGNGIFARIVAFIKHATSLGSEIIVQSIMTRQNYKWLLDKGVKYAMDELKASTVNLIPLYSSDINERGMFYVQGYNKDELCLKKQEIHEIRQHTNRIYLHDYDPYLPRYMTLYSHGKVYNCSDSAVCIGDYTDDMDILFKKLEASKHCGFCMKDKIKQEEK